MNKEEEDQDNSDRSVTRASGCLRFSGYINVDTLELYADNHVQKMWSLLALSGCKEGEEKQSVLLSLIWKEALTALSIQDSV
jgi:hypothetical protein